MAADYLPLTQSIFDQHLNKLYPYLIQVDFLTYFEEATFKPGYSYCYWKLDQTRIKGAQVYSRLSARTFNQTKLTKTMESFTNEYVVLMPRRVWQEWLNFL